MSHAALSKVTSTNALKNECDRYAASVFGVVLFITGMTQSAS